MIVERGSQALPSYGEIPSVVEVSSRLDIEELRRSDGKFLVELAVRPYAKDYDTLEPPSSWADLFDVSNWSVLEAICDGEKVGSAVIAWNSEDFDMLEGRLDLAVLADIRVRPGVQGKGVGRSLFERAMKWALERGCAEMIVETQDVNVSACRFYAAMGCTLRSLDERGYGDVDEARLIWSVRL